MSAATTETPAVIAPAPKVTNLSGSVDAPFTRIGWQGSNLRRMGREMLLAALNGQKPENATRIQTQCRAEYMVGYVAGQLATRGETLSEAFLSLARTVLSKAGKDRDAIEAAAVAASRKAWQRIIDDAGISTADSRGGKRERKQQGAEAEAAAAATRVKEATVKQAAPVFADVATTHSYLRDIAAMLLATAEKNKRVMSTEARAMVTAFCKAAHDLPDVEPSVKRRAGNASK